MQGSFFFVTVEGELRNGASFVTEHSLTTHCIPTVDRLNISDTANESPGAGLSIAVLEMFIGLSVDGL